MAQNRTKRPVFQSVEKVQLTPAVKFTLNSSRSANLIFNRLMRIAKEIEKLDSKCLLQPTGVGVLIVWLLSWYPHLHASTEPTYPPMRRNEVVPCCDWLLDHFKSIHFSAMFDMAYNPVSA
jgi:hypothetical protein